MTIAPTDVTDALVSIGVQPGTIVLVHADAIVAAQFPSMQAEQRLDLPIEAMQAAIGNSGTLAKPTFHHSFTKPEPFDSQLSECKWCQPQAKNRSTPMQIP